MYQVTAPLCFGSLLIAGEERMCRERLAVLHRPPRHCDMLAKSSLTAASTCRHIWSSTDLNICACRLTAISECVSSLTSLRSMALSHNAIAELPRGLGCLIGLKHLDLRSNRLQALPGELSLASSLQELDASENCLEQLPESLGQLKHLRTLLLDKNRCC